MKLVVTVSLTLLDEGDDETGDTPDHWMFYPKSKVEADILLAELRDGIHSMQHDHIPGAAVPYGRSHLHRKSKRDGGMHA